MGLFKRTLTKDQKNGDLANRIATVSAQIEQMSEQPVVDRFLVDRLFREVEKLEKDYLYDDDVIVPKGNILAEKGKLWAFKGDTQKALSLLTQAINLDNGNSSARKFKAFLLMNEGNTKGALNEAQAALKDRKKELETQDALVKAGILPPSDGPDSELEEINALIKAIKGGGSKTKSENGPEEYDAPKIKKIMQDTAIHMANHLATYLDTSNSEKDRKIAHAQLLEGTRIVNEAKDIVKALGEEKDDLSKAISMALQSIAFYMDNPTEEAKNFAVQGGYLVLRESGLT